MLSLIPLQCAYLRGAQTDALAQNKKGHVHFSQVTVPKRLPTLVCNPHLKTLCPEPYSVEPLTTPPHVAPTWRATLPSPTGCFPPPTPVSSEYQTPGCHQGILGVPRRWPGVSWANLNMTWVMGDHVCWCVLCVCYVEGCGRAKEDRRKSNNSNRDENPISCKEGWREGHQMRIGEIGHVRYPQRQ